MRAPCRYTWKRSRPSEGDTQRQNSVEFCVKLNSKTLSGLPSRHSLGQNHHPELG